MKADPPIRKDGRCYVCKGPRPKPTSGRYHQAEAAQDPFCSTAVQPDLPRRRTGLDQVDVVTAQAILDAIRDHPWPLSERDIAQLVNCAPSTAHVHIVRLADLGLVERRGERRLIYLTHPVTSRNCGWCGGSLEGRRADARYCCDSHRVLASKARRAA